jgi:hypothetical protein
MRFAPPRPIRAASHESDDAPKRSQHNTAARRKRSEFEDRRDNNCYPDRTEADRHNALVPRQSALAGANNRREARRTSFLFRNNIIPWNPPVL